MNYLTTKQGLNDSGDCAVHEFLQTVQDKVIVEMSNKHIVDFV